MQVPVDHGTLIVETIKGAAADHAGLRDGSQFVRIGRQILPVGGDIIAAVNGQPIQCSSDLTIYLETKTRVGEKIDLAVIRSGQEQLCRSS